MSNEIAIVNPRGNMETALEICKYIYNRTDELLAAVAAVEVTADNWCDPKTTATVKDLTDAVEDLRDSGKRLVAEVCEATEAKRVLTAIDARLWNYSTKADPLSAYAKLTAALKALKAKIADFKAAALPPAQTHSYVMRFTATDAATNKIIQAAVKAGAEGVLVASAQSDKAVKQIAKWFEKNV